MLDSSLFTELRMTWVDDSKDSNWVGWFKGLRLRLTVQRTRNEVDDLKDSGWVGRFKGLRLRLTVQRTRTYCRLMIQRPQADSDDSKASDWGWWFKEPGLRWWFKGLDGLMLMNKVLRLRLAAQRDSDWGCWFKGLKTEVDDSSNCDRELDWG